MENTESLFDKLGGMASVNAAVDIFYKKVLADDSISHFFKNSNMATQAGKQKAFLAYAFGAVMPYSGKNMRAAHAGMNLTDEHFGAVARHLVATLKELNVPQNLIDEVVAVASSTKNDIVGQ